MRIFNRIVVLLLLAGLFALGVFVALHAFELSGYRLSNLARTLGLSALVDGATSFVRGLESGSLGTLPVFVLVSLVILGLVLLLLELRPRTPRRVRLGPAGTFAERRAVQGRVEAFAGQAQEVMESSARVKARRGTGARVDLTARIPRGEDSKGVETDLKRRLQRRLEEKGVPVKGLKIGVQETDPRESKGRVR
jgi:hypothetical protein